MSWRPEIVWSVYYVCMYLRSTYLCMYEIGLSTRSWQKNLAVALLIGRVKWLDCVRIYPLTKTSFLEQTIYPEWGMYEKSFPEWRINLVLYVPIDPASPGKSATDINLTGIILELILSPRWPTLNHGTSCSLYLSMTN